MAHTQVSTHEIDMASMASELKSLGYSLEQALAFLRIYANDDPTPTPTPTPTRVKCKGVSNAGNNCRNHTDNPSGLCGVCENRAKKPKATAENTQPIRTWENELGDNLANGQPFSQAIKLFRAKYLVAYLRNVGWTCKPIAHDDAPQTWECTKDNRLQATIHKNEQKMFVFTLK